MSVGVLVLAGAVWAAPPPASPAEQRIEQARRAIAANPARPDAHNDLALALARRARETGDPAYYDRAEQALAEAFRLQPDHFEAQKLRVWLLLGRHEFARALEAAQGLKARSSDDPLVYGLLTDAYVELGRYAEAEESAQWMLDLRPGQVPALTRAAGLRELFGDLAGAVDLLEQSYHRTPPAEVEDRAWILTQLGHLRLTEGRLEDAEKLLQAALTQFEGYHYALGTLARLRTAQARHEEAVALERRRYEAAPHPENLYALGEALERAGHGADGRRSFVEFEARARQESARADNANRELVFYYADRARRPTEALRVARLEVARRQDVQTLHAYAWALAANGRYAEARTAIEKALAVGVRDAAMRCHAGMIAAGAGDPDVAVPHLEACLRMGPPPELARKARQTLSLQRARRRARS